MAKVTAVIFDIYKTLLDNRTDEEDPAAYQLLSQWISYYGIRIDPGSLRRRYQELCSDEMVKLAGADPDFDIGRVFYRILSDGRSGDFDTAEKSREMALLFRMLTTQSLSVYPGVFEMLAALKGRVKLGIASNAQRLFTIPELNKFDLLPFFETIALSSDVGSRKPEPELFLTAASALGVEPNNAVYVGDNITDDIFGASRIGMQTVWINHDARPPESDGKHWKKPDFEIEGKAKAYQRLTELLLSLV